MGEAEYDPNLLVSLPQEVINAARVLEEYFGHTDWALGGVCSRLMFERTKTRLEHEQARSFLRTVGLTRYRIYDVEGSHEALLWGCSARPLCAAPLAEYRTHWQLSLDGNLPGEIRAQHSRLANSAMVRCLEIFCGLK